VNDWELVMTLATESPGEMVNIDTAEKLCEGEAVENVFILDFGGSKITKLGSKRFYSTGKLVVWRCVGEWSQCILNLIIVK
jgi:hypothetical protein